MFSHSIYIVDDVSPSASLAIRNSANIIYAALSRSIEVSSVMLTRRGRESNPGLFPGRKIFRDSVLVSGPSTRSDGADIDLAIEEGPDEVLCPAPFCVHTFVPGSRRAVNIFAISPVTDLHGVQGVFHVGSLTLFPFP